MAEKTFAELEMWDEVKDAMSGIIADDDNNNGYVHGVYTLFDFDEKENYGERMEAFWFKTEKERGEFIDTNNLEIINP